MLTLSALVPIVIVSLMLLKLLSTSVRQNLYCYPYEYLQINFTTSTILSNISNIGDIFNNQLSIILIAFFCAKSLIKFKFHHNPRSRLHSHSQIDNDRIIIALQIVDFSLIQVINRKDAIYHQKVKQIVLKVYIIQSCNGQVMAIIISHYFLFKRQNNFYQRQSHLKNSNICETLLNQTQLNDYFLQQRRKHNQLSNSDTLKHAIEVDNESRRVIIITPDKNDHSIQDQKYFLVRNPRQNSAIFLKETLHILKKLTNRNKNIDLLHDQLAQIKAQLEMNQVLQNYSN